MTINDLRLAFTTPRTDHPGRKGGLGGTKPKHRDPYGDRRTHTLGTMYVVRGGGTIRKVQP